MTRIERLFARERFWERLSLWALRNYKSAQSARKWAQREAYLRNRALTRPTPPRISAVLDDEEDEFFG